MRKIFTRLTGIFILSMVFVIQGFAQSPTLTPHPDSDFANHKMSDTFVFSASEKVIAGVGVVRIKEGTTTLAAYQADNSNVAITENADGDYEVAINFSSLLEESKGYTLEFENDFVTDEDLNPLTGTLSWGITVGDFTAPELADTDPFDPENGEDEAIQLDATLTVAFDENVQVAADGQVYIYTDNGTPFGNLFEIVEGAALSTAANVLTIDPVSDFEGLTTYYVTIPEGAIVDDSGNDNEFAGWLDNTTWAFTTRDAEAPEVTEISEDNVEDEAFDVVLQLDKPGVVYVLAVDKDAAAPADAVVIANGETADVETADTDVTVAISEFWDGAAKTLVEGNSYDVYIVTENTETIDPTQSAAIKEITVTTSDLTAPSVVLGGFYPEDGATASDINENHYLTLELSEDVLIGTGSVSIYTWNSDLNHELLINVPASACMIGEVGEDSLYIPVDSTLWVSEATYYVNYTEGLVVDEAGNKLAAITTTEDWKFTVQDFLAPTYEIDPEDGTTDADPGTPQVTITFDEALYSDDAETPMVSADIANFISLKLGTVAAPFTGVLAGNVITLDITTVGSNDEFELSIDTKKIFDFSGNVGTTVDVVTFKIIDFEGPVVTIEPLEPGASDNILVKFDEKVYNTDGSEITDADVENILIFRKGVDVGGALVAATYSVAADGESFIIDPDEDFTTPGDPYYVRIGAGAVIDAAENENALTDETIYVADFIAPTAEFSANIEDSPVNPAGLVVTLTFDEAMATLDGTAVAATDDATELVNLKEDGENVAFAATWTSTMAMTIVPTGGYDYGKIYDISIGKSLEDLAGNAFEGISASFFTWSNIAPEPTAVTPEDEATEQENDVVIEVEFDQELTLGAGTVTFTGTTATVGTIAVDGNVLEIPHGDFATNETIVVNVAANTVTNANGDGNVAFSWTFETKDTQAPDVVEASCVPTIDVKQIDVAVSDSLVLVFDEEVALGSGQFIIKDAATDVTAQTLTVADAVLYDDEITLKIGLSTDLEYGKGYYVVVTPGVVEDLAGNDFAGFTATTYWDFATAATPGVFDVIATNPEDEEDKVPADIAELTVQFNRDIKDGSLSATEEIGIFDVLANQYVFLDVANTARFSTSGDILTVQTLGDLEVDKHYRLRITAGVVTDEFDTPNGPTHYYDFYTYDNNAPEVASHTPDVDAEDVAVNTTIVVAWDEMPYNVDGSDITAADIKTNSLVSISGGVGTNYTAAVSGMQWTLTLDADLTEKTDYTVTVDLAKVEDENGTEGAGTYTWSFTTIDATINKPTAFTVTADSGTEIDFTVTFDETGMVYYVVLPADADAPTAAEIIAADNGIEFATAGVSAAETVTDLVSGEEYNAYLVAVDLSENVSEVYAPDAFTTADIIKPMVVEMIPANDSVGVGADTDLVLTFDEDIAVGAGSIVIREVATDIIAGTLDVPGVAIAIVDETATITTGLILGNETEYYVEVASGTFTDDAAVPNPMDAIAGVDTWSFTTKDTENPLLVQTYPKYDSIPTPEIPVGTELWMEFDEEMKVVSGAIYVKHVVSEDVFEVINSDALTLSADMKTISFDLTNVPVEQATFYVDMEDIVLTDAADNPWENIFVVAAEKDWAFVILDQTPPALASSTPADEDTDVDIATNIVLTFTEAIYAAPDGDEFNGTDAKIEDVVTLMDAAGETIDAAVSINAGYTIVTIDPDADLDSETEYTVYVSPVVDNRDNISDEITVTFVTKDMTPPYVTIWDPEYDTSFNPKTGVVTVTFNEPIYDEVLLATGEGNKVVVDIVDENIVDFFTYYSGTITRDADDEIDSWTPDTEVVFTGTISDDKMVIVLTPDEDEVPLTSEGWYRVELENGVIMDEAANPNVMDETIFQIEDHIAPEVVDIDPYSPVGGTAADEDMTITFDEAIAVGTGNIYIRNYVNGEVVETIAVDETTVTVEDDDVTVTIDHADFPENMDFFVTADAGVITDASTNANPWEGIATDDIDEWNFSTADFMAPEVAEDGLYPVPGATNVPGNTDIKITFDKQVEIGTGWIVIYNEDWTPFETIDVTTPGAIDIESVTEPVLEVDRVVSINHMNLDANSTYYVRVNPGAIVDKAGNDFEGIVDNSWSFTTEDDMAPDYEALTPEDDAEGVNAYTNLMIEFDRNVLANAAGMIKLYKEEPGVELGTLIETIDPTSDAVVIDGVMATITLGMPMENETGYYVIVEPGAFTNTSSSKLPFAGITTTQEWNFTTGEDINGPMLIDWTPNGETLPDNHPTFEMTFNENVVLGDMGYLYVTEKDSTEATLMIEITEDMIVDNVVTVDYEYDSAIGGLLTDTEYFVTVDSAVVKDALGNAFEGLDDIGAWTFTTGPDVATPVAPEFETFEFKVYPNPFNDRIMIDNNEKLVRVVISNIAGQRVIDVEYPEHIIRTGDLVSGMYIVSMFTEEGIAKTSKIIKK